MIIIIADPPTVENASFIYESHMVIVRMGVTSSMLKSFSDHPEHVFWPIARIPMASSLHKPLAGGAGKAFAGAKVVTEAACDLNGC